MVLFLNVNSKSWPPREHDQLVNSIFSFPGGVSLVKGKQGSLMIHILSVSYGPSGGIKEVVEDILRWRIGL